jgi:capsular exopolysaccharide synthesis family protein
MDSLKLLRNNRDMERKDNAPPYLKYFMLMKSKKWRLLLVFSVVFLAVVLNTVFTRPVYEATTSFYIENSSPELQIMPGLEQMYSPVSRIDTEVEILKSRSMAEEVVRGLRLDCTTVYTSPGVSANIINVSVPPEFIEKVYTIKFISDSGDFELYDPRGEKLGAGSPGIAVESISTSLLVSNAKVKPGDILQYKVRDFVETVNGIRRNFKFQTAQSTNIINVSYRDTDPKTATLVANRLAQVYIRQNVSRKSQVASQILDFIEDQLQRTKHNLQKAEDELNSFKTTEGMIVLSDEAKNIISKISSFETERAEIELNRRQAEQIYHQLLRGDASEYGYILSRLGINDPTISTMVASLIDLDMQKRALLSEFTENHPQVKIYEARITSVKSKILSTVKGTVESARKREQILKSSISSYETNLKKFPETEIILARLQRSSTVNEDIYTFLLKKQEESRIAKASTVGSIRIIDPAIVPRSPVLPNVQKNLLLGAFAGLILGLFLITLTEYMDDSVKSVEDVEHLLGLPVYGIIPHISSVNSKGKFSISTGPGTRPLLTNYDKRSPFAEAYRTLRTNIQFADLEYKVGILQVTSTMKGEGKSTTAANLAVAMSYGGHKTIIVDCDLRKPSIHHFHKIPLEPGVTNVLLHAESLKGAIRHSDIENLDVLTAGPIPPNPSELLGTTSMKNLLQELRTSYDFVIVDTPPIMAVTDPLILSMNVDAVFLVIEAASTSLPAVKRAKAQLESLRAKVKGAILNNLKADSMSGYEYYYYYSNYDYGYGSERPESAIRKLSKSTIREIKGFLDKIVNGSRVN